MEKYFSRLETKIDRVIAQCDRLRSENQSLRQELIHQVDEVRVLKARMEEARQRLEQLMEQEAQ
jgi:uncharacterized protein (TIGR02449 family)